MVQRGGEVVEFPVSQSHGPLGDRTGGRVAAAGEHPLTDRDRFSRAALDGVQCPLSCGFAWYVAVGHPRILSGF
jgi:hypothetical protein